MAGKHVRVALCIMIMIMVMVAGAGCQRTPKQRLVGKWRGTIEFNEVAVQQKREETSKNPIAKFLLEKAIQGLESGTVDIELKADDTYTLMMKLGPLERGSYGKWEVLSVAGNLVVARLIDQKGKVEEVTLKFLDDHTFTMNVLGKASKDLAVFRCTRVQVEG